MFRQFRLKREFRKFVGRPVQASQTPVSFSKNPETGETVPRAYGVIPDPDDLTVKQLQGIADKHEVLLTFKNMPTIDIGGQRVIVDLKKGNEEGSYQIAAIEFEL